MIREDKGPTESLKQIIKMFGSPAPFIGRVKRGTVDEAKHTCEVLPSTGGAKLDRVFLNVVGDSNLVVVPADDSHVLCLYSLDFKNQAYIVACSKIKKIILKSSPAGSLSIDMSDSGFDIKVGADGRVKITGAGTQLGTGAQKMVRGDELLTLLQQIITLLQTTVAWGLTVTPPLSDAVVPTIPATLLSSKNKVE